MASAGVERLLAARRRGPRPETVAPLSFAGSSALALAAAGARAPRAAPAAEREGVAEVEPPASACARVPPN